MFDPLPPLALAVTSSVGSHVEEGVFGRLVHPYKTVTYLQYPAPLSHSGELRYSSESYPSERDLTSTTLRLTRLLLWQIQGTILSPTRLFRTFLTSLDLSVTNSRDAFILLVMTPP